MLINALKEFFLEEDGAVTVDWVVLTAGIVGLGVGVILQLNNSTSNVATRISDCVADQPLHSGGTC